MSIVPDSWAAPWACVQVDRDVTCTQTSSYFQSVALQIEAAADAAPVVGQQHASATLAGANDPDPAADHPWTLRVEATADMVVTPTVESLGGASFAATATLSLIHISEPTRPY